MPKGMRVQVPPRAPSCSLRVYVCDLIVPFSGFQNSKIRQGGRERTLTATSSHELCEAITDPIPGAGWYNDTNGEIGDICAWSFKQVAGYMVQLEWSDQQQKCV